MSHSSNHSANQTPSMGDGSQNIDDGAPNAADRGDTANPSLTPKQTKDNNETAAPERRDSPNAPFESTDGAPKKEDDNVAVGEEAERGSRDSNASQKNSAPRGHSNSPQVKTAVKQTASRNVARSVVPSIKMLADLAPNVESDCFVQLVERELLKTKDGKPYYKVLFRDCDKSANAFIWLNSPFFADCENNWRVGAYYKIRATARDSNYGVKLELRRVRETNPADKEDGFDPNKCRPCSKTPPETLASEILALAQTHIGKGALLQLIQRIFKERRLALCEAAASRLHHHTYPGGLLEHALSTTKIAIMLYDHYVATFPQLGKRLSKPLLVAGAILHDVGKILDSVSTPVGSKKTVQGRLVGHPVLGVEIVLRYADAVQLEPNLRVQLEHLILTHSRFPDWGSPSPPTTLEAMLLHYADYADSTFASALKIIEEDDSSGEFTARNSPFGAPLFKNLRVAER